MAESLPIKTTSSTGITQSCTEVTPNNATKLLSLSADIVQVLQSEPDRIFLIQDFVDRTGGTRPAIKTALSRLSSGGKKSGPVRRIERGMYQYDPAKEHKSLMALGQSGNWKTENLTFVTKEAYPSTVLLSGTVPEASKVTKPNSRLPTPHANYPWTLPTGHLVTWDDYENGTQVIRISANGAPPLSPDTVLLILSRLRDFGMDDNWNCVSLELNVDSRKLRIDASYSLQLIEGVLLKTYQHGYNARLEIADRRNVPVREVMELFHVISVGLGGNEALREVKTLNTRIQRIEKMLSYKVNIAPKSVDRSYKDSTHSLHPGNGKMGPAPAFRKASDLFKERVPVTDPQEGKTP